ncbi:hypothetical protein RUND412_005856 [Rhizina undulata]
MTFLSNVSQDKRYRLARNWPSSHHSHPTSKHASVSSSSIHIHIHRKKIKIIMPIPLFTSEKPSTSETHLPPSQSESVNEPLHHHTQSGSQPATSSVQQEGRSGSTGQTKEEEEEAARLYEERIEEEYAKREGGA